MRGVAVVYSVCLVVVACSAATGPQEEGASAATPPPRIAIGSPALVIATAAPAASATVRIEMGDNFFAPDTVTVAVGTTVEWTIGTGEQPHDVIAVEGSFRSGSPMNRGDIFAYTFTKPGEYAYVCSFHIPEGMIGKIVVR